MNICKAINAVMADIGAIGKNSKNTTQGFMYRGVDAVMNALQPAMVKHSIFVVPEVLDQTREERTNAKGTTLLYSILRVKFTFFADDGSNVSAVVIGEGMDTGDKASNKAMSVAFKYACFQVFCIPTEEMKDPDAECHEVAPKSRRQERIEDVASQKIGTAKVNSILKKCEEDGINPAMVCSKCNVTDLSELTEKQYAWVAHNWSKEFKGGE
jgi:hypothetical protein